MGYNDINITNPTKIITFTKENDTFEVNLIRKRAKNSVFIPRRWKKCGKEVKMVTKSMKQCIKQSDLITALKNYENTSPNWKKRWFDTCYEIAQKTKDIFNSILKQYIFDPVEKVITKIAEQVKKTVSKKCKNGSHTYLIKMFDENGKHVFTKIGKADNLKRRMSEFVNHEYKRQNKIISAVEIIKEYCLPSDDLAQVLESFMRNYFRKNRKEEFYPNDRFSAFEPNENDLMAFDRYYNLTVNAEI